MKTRLINAVLIAVTGFFMMFMVYHLAHADDVWMDAGVRSYMPSDDNVMSSTGGYARIGWKAVYLAVGTLGEQTDRAAGQRVADRTTNYVDLGLRKCWSWDWVETEIFAEAGYYWHEIDDSPTQLHALKLHMMKEFGPGSSRDDKGGTNFNRAQYEVDNGFGGQAGIGIKAAPWDYLKVGLNAGYLFLQPDAQSRLLVDRPGSQHDYRVAGCWQETGKRKLDGLFIGCAVEFLF